MINFSLNTFIKICLLDTGGRISEIQKRLNGPGGYDFYKPLQKAVRAHCSGGSAQIDHILDAPVNSIERKHNREAYEAFKEKFGATKTLEAINAKKTINFSKAGISITVDPLFEVTKSGTRQAYCIWPTQKPQVTQKYGALACHLMRRAYGSGPLANCSFLFADMVNNKIYSEKQITNNTNLILMADVNSIGTLVKEL